MIYDSQKFKKYLKEEQEKMRKLLTECECGRRKSMTEKLDTELFEQFMQIEPIDQTIETKQNQLFENEMSSTPVEVQAPVEDCVVNETQPDFVLPEPKVETIPEKPAVKPEQTSGQRVASVLIDAFMDMLKDSKTSSAAPKNITAISKKQSASTEPNVSASPPEVPKAEPKETSSSTADWWKSFLNSDSECKSTSTASKRTQSLSLSSDSLVATAIGNFILQSVLGGSGSRLSGSDGTPKSILNVKGPNGSTPLHLAVSLGSIELTERLLKAGSDVSIVDHQGRTPLHIAIENEDILIVHAILDSLFPDASPTV